MFTILLSAFINFAPNAAADCADVPDRKIELVPVECHALNPERVSSVRADFAEYAKHFRGALILTQQERFVYITDTPQPCDEFPIGKKIKKMRSFPCCDAGPIGICGLKGAIIHDVPTALPTPAPSPAPSVKPTRKKGHP